MTALDSSVAIAPQQCPHCGHLFNRTEVGPGGHARPPKAGDISLCVECATILLFVDEAGRMRTATAEDIHQLMAQPELWERLERTQMAILEARRRAQVTVAGR